jgi:hypothetical protein
MYNFRVFPGLILPETPLLREGNGGEVEKVKVRGREEEKRYREGQLEPQVQKHGDAPAFNTKCCIRHSLYCEPTTAGDTEVHLYVHHVDNDAF